MLAALPHAPPFRFVTRVMAVERGGHAQGIWIVRGDEEFFSGHFPGNPIVPGVLIGEALAQLSGVVCCSAAHPPPVQGRLAHIDMKFLRAVSPPAEIALRSELVRSLEPLHQCSVEASVLGAIVARGTLTLTIGKVSTDAEHRR